MAVYLDGHLIEYLGCVFSCLPPSRVRHVSRRQPCDKLPTCPRYPLCRPMTTMQGFRWHWPQTVVLQVEFNSFLKQQQKPTTIQNATAGGPNFPERCKAHLYIWNRNLCSPAKCLKGSREKRAHLSLDLVLNIFEGSCFLCSYVMIWTTFSYVLCYSQLPRIPNKHWTKSFLHKCSENILGAKQLSLIQDNLHLSGFLSFSTSVFKFPPD